MNRSGMGVGSASIILIFAVLCLTIFTLISYTSANVDKAMSDISVEIIQSYYEADTLAECILAEILESDTTPDTVFGTDIESEWDFDIEHIKFSCPVSDSKSLCVEVAIDGGSSSSYEILMWKLSDIGEWEADDSLNVWLGD